MDLIKNIHQYLAADISKMNQLILSHLVTKEELVEMMGKYLVEAGGKRIRPLLTILTSKMLGYEGEDNIKLATAVEFIHAATLLHDDVVDGSKLRRFRPTANIIWGNKASILVGDFLFSQSFKLMVATKSLAALQSLSEASAIIAEGEVAQLARLNERRILDLSEYEEIITAKTAELFGAACFVGALIANQDEEIGQTMRQFGINLGHIFQISDDLLDYFGKQEQIGKNIGDDFLEGKVTLPLILLYNKIEEKEKKSLQALLRQDSRSWEDFANIQSLLGQYKIKEDIMKYLENLEKKASTLLSKINIENIFKKHLNSLVEFAMNRVY